MGDVREHPSTTIARAEHRLHALADAGDSLVELLEHLIAGAAVFAVPELQRRIDNYKRVRKEI